LFETIGLIRMDQENAEDSPRSAGKDVLDPLGILESDGGTNHIDIYIPINKSEGTVEVDVANPQLLTSGLH
jgi:hypothetical protein